MKKGPCRQRRHGPRSSCPDQLSAAHAGDVRQGQHLVHALGVRHVGEQRLHEREAPGRVVVGGAHEEAMDLHALHECRHERGPGARREREGAVGVRAARDHQLDDAVEERPVLGDDQLAVRERLDGGVGGVHLARVQRSCAGSAR
jgi:hypothetical protein